MSGKLDHPGGAVLRNRFKQKQLKTSAYDGMKLEQTERTENMKHWITLFRRNWEIYAEMVLELKLKPFQKIMLHLMGVSDVFFAICSRGLGKSFIAGVAAVCKMNLYPYSEVVITSSTVPQANKLVEQKIRDELIKKLSPYLLYLYEKEHIVITRSEDCYKIVNNLNGSTLLVLACLDSSRGPRATLIIYEEARLLKKSIIDSVFEKMAHPRQAKFVVEYPELYANNPRWLEESQSIYITSARYKFEWFYTRFKDCVRGYYMDRKINYNVFAGDIFLSIDNGLKTWVDFYKAKKSNEMEWRIEDKNEMIGESDDSFFSYQHFTENQTIKKCFTPPTGLELYLGTEIPNRQREADEVRIVAVDYAFANTTKSNEINDNTIIICFAGIWKKNRFERRVEYIEAYPASDTLGASDRARELFFLYDADYLAPDTRNGGEVLFNRMTQPWEPNEHFGMPNFHGLTISDQRKYQIVPDAKLADLRDRTVDPKAIPAIIPFIGTPELNSACWVELRKQLELKNIQFLIPAQDRQEDIENSGEYFKMTSEEVVKAILPYGQTDSLIQEAVSLKTEIKNDKIKLTEPSRYHTKDRIVILSYANYLMSLIENEWEKQNHLEEYDIEDMELIW